MDFFSYRYGSRNVIGIGRRRALSLIDNYFDLFSFLSMSGGFDCFIPGF
jgi:hypothetical protein